MSITATERALVTDTSFDERTPRTSTWSPLMSRSATVTVPPDARSSTAGAERPATLGIDCAPYEPAASSTTSPALAWRYAYPKLRHGAPGDAQEPESVPLELT